MPTLQFPNIFREAEFKNICFSTPLTNWESWNVAPSEHTNYADWNKNTLIMNSALYRPFLIKSPRNTEIIYNIAIFTKSYKYEVYCTDLWYTQIFVWRNNYKKTSVRDEEFPKSTIYRISCLNSILYKVSRDL